MKNFMQPFRVACLVLGAACLPFGGTARADSASSARAAIQAAYNAQDAGYAAEDISAILSHTAPDFVIVGGGRNADKAFITEGLRQIFQRMAAMHAKMTHTTTVQKVALSQNRATVLTRVHIQMTGVSARTGKVVTTDTSMPTQDTWVKTKSVWLEKSFHEVGVK